MSGLETAAKLVVILALSISLFLWLLTRAIMRRIESEGQALQILEDNNVVFGLGTIFIPRDRELNEKTWEAITFLCNEWDYDWTDA